MSEGLPGWVVHEEEGLKSYAVPDCEAFLDWMARRGFLFHGSPFAIKDVLEPRRANTGGVPNEYEGVFLTDVPPLAIFCALVEKQPRTIRSADIVRETSIGRSRFESHYRQLRLTVDGAERIRSHGYVYLIPKEEAEGREGEHYVAFRKLRPSLVLRVTRSDLRYEIEVAGQLGA
jgi:hypothetical protein